MKSFFQSIRGSQPDTPPSRPRRRGSEMTDIDEMSDIFVDAQEEIAFEVTPARSLLSSVNISSPPPAHHRRRTSFHDLEQPSNPRIRGAKHEPGWDAESPRQIQDSLQSTNLAPQASMSALPVLRPSDNSFSMGRSWERYNPVVNPDSGMLRASRDAVPSTLNHPSLYSLGSDPHAGSFSYASELSGSADGAHGISELEAIAASPSGRQSSSGLSPPTAAPVRRANDLHPGGSTDGSLSVTPSIMTTATETRYQKRCEVCNEFKKEIWYCNVCETSYCDNCWGSQFIHNKPRGGIRHEKTNVEIAEKVHGVLSPPTDNWVREQLYRADEVTSWFGIARPDDNAPLVFQDYGRFADLMATIDPVRHHPSFMERWAEIGRDRRTPSLVSYVGQTGAGKSTLVKLLIDFGLSGTTSYSTPVVGPRGAHLPTSEDVHLYLDPRTSDSPGPLLFADCEGLEGGEREPLGAKFRRMRRSAEGKNESSPDTQARKNNKVISERELEWASESRTRSREFAVTNLYPRLLYTFSDVIVFVLRNPRTIEHVFEKLVVWAAAAIETSSNQPVLPHAIIALNASEHDIDEKLWGMKYNTETILEDLAHTVNRNANFRKWTQFWRERGKPIENLEQLILCYYSSIQIIRLPTEGRPRLMAEQVENLYKGTLSACVAEAFNHFSKTLETPFDFVQASFWNSPIPPDFGGNILKLALGVAKLWKDDPLFQAKQIFSHLSYMVASCIMLDSSRHKNKGFAEQIFPKYINHLDDAVENFCDHHWPCEFVHSRTSRRCVNVRSGHTKGHQSADGKVVAAGEYVSKFSFDINGDRFRRKVYACLVQLLQQLTASCRNGEPEERAAAEIHKSMVMNSFFSRAARYNANAKSHASLSSHTACFCCLFGQAEHFLPCGHVLCTECLRTYGESGSVHTIKIVGCPMEEISGRREDAWIVYLKPHAAGVRVLTLDGGGIRGIVELEVLNQIEEALGGVAIQHFFDLMVGTSTGGLVALGLGPMQWRVSECIEQFVTLCGEVFTRRTGGTLPVIGSFIDNYHHSRYQTSTLVSALQQAFSEDLFLFGGQQPAGSVSPVKVAVTATNLAGNKTYLLANYNQPRDAQKSNHYHFQRPETSDAELRIWEAARATSAAPRYFKSYHHDPSHKRYIDGAVLHNNPIRIADLERRILWPECPVPDIILSLGTGSSASLTRASSDYTSAPRKGVITHGRQLYSILRNNMDQTLDCDRAWEDFFDGITSTTSTTAFAISRYRRINPDLGTVPALDEKDRMEELRRKVQETLQRDQPRLRDIARQLIASTFYFELISASDADADGKFSVQGKIQCRLPQPSAEICELAKNFRKRTVYRNEQMRFIIFEDAALESLKTVHMTDRTLDTMIREGVFKVAPVRFRVKNKVTPTQIVLKFGEIAMHPVSGFPRYLFAEEEQQGSASQPTFQSSRASTRYTHGSRRLMRSTRVWKAPDFQSTQSLSNLNLYADRQRALGDDGAEPENSTFDTELTSRPALTAPLVTLEPSPLTKGVTRKRNGVRDAFKALWWASKSRKSDENLQSGIQPTELPVDLQQWLSAYRQVRENISGSQHGVEIPDGQLAFSLQFYNVKPEEYAMYLQWVSLLQPTGTGTRELWLPPVINRVGDFARSSPDAIFELTGDHNFAAELPENVAGFAD
ncbi:putative PNPLA domain-containing protein [Seiridium unicorne]|uniref:PNPLA domain-containing protein n=1 Tax=Seiridium unicorne TaxID=138068 RepID=A0ABR2URI6_9PEZI